MPFIEAVLTLAGMIIGVGMFAIPFSFVRAGFWLGAGELATLALVVLWFHLLYGEIVLAVPAFHRMPGYIRIYLGRRAAALSWFSTMFGSFGALLAYLAAGALFLHTIFATVLPDATIFFWASALATVAALINFSTLKKTSAINAALSFLLIAFIIFLSARLLPRMSFDRLPAPAWASVFAPYGVLLFALTGGSVIPDVITLLGRRRAASRAAIAAGSLIPAILYFLFALAVVGVTGAGTSEEAIAGLGRVAGFGIAWWGSVIGLLAVFTSLVALSENMGALFRLDLGVPDRAAWAIIATVPYALYLAGLQNFIAIISIVGVVGFGIDAFLIVLAHRALRRRAGRRRSATLFVECAVAVVALIGVGAYVYGVFIR